jgi:hypothetical protein
MLLLVGLALFFALEIQTPTRAFLLDNQGKTQLFGALKFFLFFFRNLGLFC